MKAGNNERGMYSDRTAYRIGDIVTVTLDESFSMDNKREFSYSNEPKQANEFTKIITNKFMRLVDKNFTYPTTTLGKNEAKNSGEVKDSNALTGTVSALVIDILPNGNLVIEGARKKAFSNTTQYEVLSGIVRPDDITSTNTISSSKVADLRLELIGEGDINATQSKGWLTKFSDSINPF
ncbi:MAG: hypothetical protein A2Y14_04755 [Verrucomicrobia bacterium GWF2_51_19]|nr:MAG: hypothetical protein A2Y14_04755 [Verrucomicrobia bacterium GWF2_51_19]